MSIVKSPFNSLPPKKVRDLPRSFLLKELEVYYQATPPAEAVECDYALWECVETGLQFAWPMVPGNARFYEWVSSFPSYYPQGRWEYRRVSELLASRKSQSNFSVLDVGCGKGDFLRSLNSLSEEKRFGLDLNAPAIEACRKNGFQAFCGTMEAASEAGFLTKQFSAVTSFHCLEHVPNPVEFVKSLVEATAPGGSVFISTPYSPMSFETEHFDILNHPPHHLTRWNLAAYQKLAEILGVKLRYFTPCSSALKRTLAVFRLLHYGPYRPVSRRKLATDLVTNVPEIMRLYREQKQRRAKNQGIEADVILVEFQV
jgi:SAM-dependent methyltransferase